MACGPSTCGQSSRLNSELDRQRQVLQSLTDLRHRAHVAHRALETGIYGPGALCEELHRLGRVERRHRIDLFAGDAKRGATGAEHPQTLAGGQEIGDVCPDAWQVLQIIEDKQHLAVAEVVQHPLCQRLTRHVGHAGRLGDERRHLVRIGRCLEGDEDAAVGEIRLQASGGGKAEAGLAHAAGAGKGDQAHLGQIDQLDHGAQFGLPADEGGGRPGQPIDDGLHGHKPKRHGIEDREKGALVGHGRTRSDLV
jgi:hypothetical protein